MSTLTVTNPTHCPLCGQANACAMETERATGQPQPPCWCTGVAFPPALLEQVPRAERGQACICRACAEQAGQAARSGA
ncbi:MAG: cysteine-rich CWC family protein [Pseudomonadota bacterium]|nr:cysteine-rich CWC family protein [Pseudomonadota bacterium]